jgi:hypothetical protein
VQRFKEEEEEEEEGSAYPPTRPWVFLLSPHAVLIISLAAAESRRRVVPLADPAI